MTVEEIHRLCFVFPATGPLNIYISSASATGSEPGRHRGLRPSDSRSRRCGPVAQPGNRSRVRQGRSVIGSGPRDPQNSCFCQVPERNVWNRGAMSRNVPVS